MPTIRFTINNVSIINYIAEDGIKWTLNTIDGPNAGRNINGTMIRDVVAQKVRLDIKCRPLTNVELMSLLPLLKPEFVTVRYYDPLDGLITKSMYSNNVPSQLKIIYENGVYLYDGIEFPLIER